MTKFEDEYYDSFLFKTSKNASFNNIFSINDFDDKLQYFAMEEC